MAKKKMEQLKKISLLAANLRGNVVIVVKSAINYSNVIRNQTTMAETLETQNICSYCRKSRNVKKSSFKLKRKESQSHNNHASRNNGNCDYQVFDSQDVTFPAITECQKLSNDIWICDRGACCHSCNNKEGL